MKTESEITFEEIMQWESKLGEAGCFTNGFTGRKCSAGCYGTVFSWEAFDSVWRESDFTREGWREIAAYYRFQWYLSPVFGLLAVTIARKLGFPSPLEKTAEIEAFYS